MSVVVAVDGSGAPVVDNAILLANCTTEIGIRNTLILAVSYRKISVVHAVSLLIIKKNNNNFKRKKEWFAIFKVKVKVKVRNHVNKNKTVSTTP